MPDVTTALSSSTRSANQTLHVLVGRSIFIKSVSRLKRVYVSNPVAVDSFPSSPTQIVVTAKTPGVSSLILWDEAGQSTSYLVFSDLDVASLQKEIHEALPYDNIKVEAAAGPRFSLRHGVERCFRRGGGQAGRSVCESRGQFRGGETTAYPAGEATG